MKNKELGEFIAQENFSSTSNMLVQKTEEIIGAGTDVVTSFFFGLPFYSILKPFIEGLKDWKSRVELKQLAYYLKEFENLNQGERSEFSLMIQANEEDFTERLFFYVTQLNDKRKASLCGKLGVSYARKKITSEVFLRLIYLVSKSNFEDLMMFKNHVEGSKFLERFASNQEEFFTTPSAFKYIFPKSEAVLINELKSLGLIIQEIDSTSLKTGSPQGVSLDKISKALGKFKVVEKLTENALWLYFHGLRYLG